MADSLTSYSPRLARALQDNLLAFWLPRCLDRTHGGYVIDFDAAGQPKPKRTKMIVTQARTVWLFARLARANLAGPRYPRADLLAAAEHGYRFLLDRMWDKEQGGFHWEVDETGERKLVPVKHLYGQSFALYALSEYALASARRDALDFAIRFFHLLEAKAHDAEYGGYIESFRPDWTEQPGGESGPLGPAGLKLMNTHMHLLEAMTAFYRASRLPFARERLLELMTIESNTVVRKDMPACTDKYDRDWRPRLEGNYARVSYGHDIENIWLLIDAADAAGVSNAPLTDLYRGLFAYSRRYGWDEDKGGFFDSGAFRQPADRREKIWWVEAEALVGALYMYRLTRDAAYLAVFEKTWDFVEKQQIDWRVGEWHATIRPDGSAGGDKAQRWKAGYHNGRALIECLEVIRGMTARG